MTPLTGRQLSLEPEVLRELAIAAKVCVRPVLLRCTDTQDGTTATVPLPCGATVERTCPSCADRARRLRMQQCREGWHRDTEPVLPNPAQADDSEDPNADDRNTDDPSAAADESDAGEGSSTRRVRSTRRRQDVADLPRVPMDARTTGKVFRSPDGRTYRPSMFLTLTLPSYGPVLEDGTPVDPASYDYRRAAMDALHFAKLEDRFWQNLRRAAGYKVQYFAAIEAQRRLAPHVHAAVRGVIPRQIVRQVVAGTYHQLWWPPCDREIYPDHGRMPTWDAVTERFIDPDTGALLPTWAQALDALDAELDADPAARPAHVLRFGRQYDYAGIIATDEDKVGRAVAYLTKYLAKDMAGSHDDPDDLTTAQAAHLDRLHAHVRVLPCSPRCANWLRYGIAPDGAGPHLQPGRCAAKAHDRHHLGLGGRRVHVSRQWTGKTLTEHAADRAEAVRQTLEAAGLTAPDRDRCSATTPGADGKARFVWSKVAHHDQDALTYRSAILAAIRERTTWREQYEHAKTRAGPGVRPTGACSATDTAA